MDRSELVHFVVIALFYIAVRALWRAIRQRKRPAPEPAYRRSVPVPFSHEWVADVKRMWTGSCGPAVLGDDSCAEDHAEVYEFIVDILNKSELSEDDKRILKLVYQGCNYEKRIDETKNVRVELLRTVRLRIKDPSWTRFPG